MGFGVWGFEGSGAFLRFLHIGTLINPFYPVKNSRAHTSGAFKGSYIFPQSFWEFRVIRVWGFGWGCGIEGLRGLGIRGVEI